jgi:ABC-type nitrate/sulfonate/bicarbonate transport system ATPase subunit/ABC-type proline/glycine betaine transport system permease subunit
VTVACRSGEARRRKRIGFVPQSPALLPWRTVEANARLLQDSTGRPTAASPNDPLALLDAVGLGEFRRAYPHELSGGMQQRVALVRAFALGAPYLLMDEPFAALDEITRADMRHLLAELCEPTGTAVVFVTHSIAEAVFLSDRVVVLSARPGRIVGSGRCAAPPSPRAGAGGHPRVLLARDRGPCDVDDGSGSVRRPRLETAMWSSVGAVGLIVVWEALVRLLDVPDGAARSEPDPLDVRRRPGSLSAGQLGDGAPSAGRARDLARDLARGGGVPGRVRELEHLAQPLLVLIMVTPWVAYITSVVLVVGSGQPAVVFLVAFVTIPAFVYATVGGMRGADTAARELFASIDASRWEVLWRLRLPSALPSIFTATRFNVGLGLGAAYFAEGAALRLDGLGDTGRRAAAFSNGEALWTTILCAALLGIAAQVALAALERWLLRWHQSQR